MAKKITYHLEIDGFPLVFDPTARKLALRFTGAAASPLNAFLASVSLSPRRLEEAIEKLVRGQDEPRGRFRLFFGATLRLEHHKRRCRTASIGPSTLLAVLDHLRKIIAGDFSAVLAASRYSLRRIKIDGIAARIRSEGGNRFLEIEGAEVDGAEILVHHFSGAYRAPEFHAEMLRTGGSRPDQGFAYGPIVYPYRHMGADQQFQAMKARWERARKRPLTEPVWMGGAAWESINHYLPLSTVRKLSGLSRRLDPDLCRYHGEVTLPYVSVEDLEIDGFPARRWDMNGVFRQVKLMLPQHNPINWMVLVLKDRFSLDLSRQLAAVARGEASPGPGTSFARFAPSDAALEHPAFAVMKVTWEASTGRRLDEPVWRAENDWESGTAFIPQSSLERLLRMVVER